MSEEAVVLEEAPEVEQDAPQTEEFDYEAEARKEGWVSEEEWVEGGKPAEIWKPAKDFYDAGQTILPIVQAKLRRVEEERRREKEQFDSRLKKIESQNESTLKMQREAWEKELKKQRATAIRDGDGEKVNELDDRIQQLREAPRAEEYVNPDAQAALNEFMERNTWYSADEDMQTYADAYAAKLRHQDANMGAREILTRVAAKTTDAFKHKLQPRKAPAVESSTRGPSSTSKKKDYANLPGDAKKACDVFLDNIPDSQQDEFRKRYVANYYSAEE